MLAWKAGLVPEGWKPGGTRTEEVPQAANAKADPSMPSSPVSATASAEKAAPSFKSLQTNMNGLLIAQLAGGEAGQVTRMHLVARPLMGSDNSRLRFNQEVGDDMMKALNEVSKFSQLRHNGWPVGHSLEIGFEDKYVDKDGPSAAVACALLVEGAITGKKWDPTFAVTGDMNGDGSVQPIGGVAAKIRGATKGACKIVGVPVKNEKSISDILVTDGPAPLVAITIFGLSKFEDALLLADPERPAALQTAMINFDSMRTVMLRNPQQLVPLLRTPHAAQRLQALYAVAPNCLSAKYLMLYLQGNTPRSLSLSGSIEAAQTSAQFIITSINHDISGISTLNGDELGSSLSKLRRMRPLLDPRVWPYADSLITFAEVIRTSISNPPTRGSARYTDMVSRARGAATSAKSNYEKLINDPLVREELGL